MNEVKELIPFGYICQCVRTLITNRGHTQGTSKRGKNISHSIGLQHVAGFFVLRASVNRLHTQCNPVSLLNRVLYVPLISFRGEVDCGKTVRSKLPSLTL